MSIKQDLDASSRYDKVAHALDFLPPEDREEVKEVILDPAYSNPEIAEWLTVKTVGHTGNRLDRKQVSHYADKLKRGIA